MASNRRGYDIKIFDTQIEDRWLCQVCSCVLRSPYQSSDGTLCCKECSGNGIGQVGTHNPDKAISRELAVLPVHCENQEKGCLWTGELKDYEPHVKDKCLFVSITCPNCGSDVLRKDTVTHRELCGQGSKTQEDMNDTKTVIPLDETTVSGGHCEFASIGCTEKREMDQQERRAHMKTGIVSHMTLLLHLIMTIEHCITAAMEDTSSLKSSLGTKIQEITHECVDELLSTVRSAIIQLTRRLSEDEQSMKLCRNEIDALKQNRNDVALTKYDLSRALKNLQVLDDKVLALEVQSLEHVEPFKDLERTAAECGSRLNKLESSFEDMFESLRKLNEIKVSAQNNPVAGFSSVMTQFPCVVPKLPSPIYPEPGSEDFSVSLDGLFLWKLRHFTEMRSNAISGKVTSLNSPPFFTGHRGYRLCGRIFLDGDGMGKGTHISLYIAVLRGPYDALLPWPFTGKVRLTLIDQSKQAHHVEEFLPDKSSQSFQRPTGVINKAAGSPLFFPLHRLQERLFIKDDTLFIKIETEPKSVW